jgi:hypothetical protein
MCQQILVILRNIKFHENVQGFFSYMQTDMVKLTGTFLQLLIVNTLKKRVSYKIYDHTKLHIMCPDISYGA